MSDNKTEARKAAENYVGHVGYDGREDFNQRVAIYEAGVRWARDRAEAELAEQKRLTKLAVDAGREEVSAVRAELAEARKETIRLRLALVEIGAALGYDGEDFTPWERVVAGVKARIKGDEEAAAKRMIENSRLRAALEAERERCQDALDSLPLPVFKREPLAYKYYAVVKLVIAGCEEALKGKAVSVSRACDGCPCPSFVGERIIDGVAAEVDWCQRIGCEHAVELHRKESPADHRTEAAHEERKPNDRT